MFMDLSQIKSGIKNKQSFLFKTDKLANLFSSDKNGRIIEAVDVHLDAVGQIEVISVQARIEAVLELNCSRCLNPFNYPINKSFSFRVSEESLNEQSDLDIVEFGDGIIDVEPLIMEAVLFEIPLIPLCKPDCLGICIRCGVNKNEKQCSCLDKEIDPRWENLKQLL